MYIYINADINTSYAINEDVVKHKLHVLGLKFEIVAFAMKLYQPFMSMYVFQDIEHAKMRQNIPDWATQTSLNTGSDLMCS